jgi:hypothetical protein
MVPGIFPRLPGTCFQSTPPLFRHQGQAPADLLIEIRAT